MNAPLRKRERGVAQYDSEYFKKQFEGLPAKAMAIIALRAAMRSLPILAYRGSIDADRLPTGKRVIATSMPWQ